MAAKPRQSLGIRYEHPLSRVVRLTDLGGVPVHPTPLYSMVWMFIVGWVLVRLWMLARATPAHREAPTSCSPASADSSRSTSAASRRRGHSRACVSTNGWRLHSWSAARR